MSIVRFFCLKFIHSCYPIFPLQKMDWNLHYFFMRTSSNVWAWPSREGFKVEAKTRLSRRSIKVKQPQVSKRPMSLQIFEQRKKGHKARFYFGATLWQNATGLLESFPRFYFNCFSIIFCGVIFCQQTSNILLLTVWDVFIVTCVFD